MFYLCIYKLIKKAKKIKYKAYFFYNKVKDNNKYAPINKLT